METAKLGSDVSVTNEEFPEPLPVMPDDMLTAEDLAAFIRTDESALVEAQRVLDTSAIEITEAQKTLEMLTTTDVANFIKGLQESHDTDPPLTEDQLLSSEFTDPPLTESKSLGEDFDEVNNALADLQGNLDSIQTGFDDLNTHFHEKLLSEQSEEAGAESGTASIVDPGAKFELPPIKMPSDLNGEALKALETSMQVQLGLYGLEQPAADDESLSVADTVDSSEVSVDGTVPTGDFTGSEARESLLSGGDMLQKINPEFAANDEDLKPVADPSEAEKFSDQVFEDDDTPATSNEQKNKPKQRNDFTAEQESTIQQAPNALAGLSMLVGAVGVAGAKLFNALGSGVEAGFDAWKDYRGKRNAEEYFAAFNNTETHLARVKEGVIGKALESLPPEEHSGVLEQLLAGDSVAAESFSDLISSMDRMRDLARKYVSHQIKSGADPEIVIDDALKPIAKLTEDNKSLLEKLTHNGQSLLTKMDGISNGLLNLVRDLIQTIARSVSLNIGGASAQNPAPVIKGVGM